MNVVFTINASSGCGRESARFFHEQGWTVIATMRKAKLDVLPDSGCMQLLSCEVADLASINRLRCRGQV